MYDAFKHKFRTDRGLLIFVPTEKGRARGEEIVEAVLKRWSPPDRFFHFQSGGHVAASRVHLSNPFFARLDIKSFFDSVTRNKVHRALYGLGFSHRAAWQFAHDSVVRKEGKPGFNLPFGFVQSPILASVALDCSALGAVFRAESSVRLSVYVDDILLSAATEAALRAYMADISRAAEQAGFELHAGKAQLGMEVEAFNLRLSMGSARVTDRRMTEFETVERTPTGNREEAIARYVEGINPVQGAALRAIYGI